MTEDTTVSEIVTLLTYVLDENRESQELVRLSHAGLVHRSTGFRRRFDAVIRTNDGFAASLAVHYLRENLGRAREHWSAGLEHMTELHTAFPDNEQVRALEDDLRRAGVHEIQALLELDAVPVRRKPAAAHLQAVLDRMSDCDQLVARARSQLTLQHMRNGPKQP